MMFKNYLSVAVRSLYKNKLTTLINLLGLAAGIAACILIMQYVNYELSYENDVQGRERTYRIISTKSDAGRETKTALSSPKLATEIKTDFPEVERFTQLMSTKSWFDCTLTNVKKQGAVIFNEPNLFFADSAFLDFFSFQLVQGNIATALKDPNTMVLTQSAVKRYFGDDNPIGEILELKGSMYNHTFVVTGVMKDPPQNTHLKSISVIGSLASTKNTPDLASSNLYNYIRLRQGTLPFDLTPRLNNFVKKYSIDQNSTTITQYLTQPITDIYLHSNFEEELHVPGNPEAVYFLLIIAALILVIAWINYVNLATSRSIERAKEIAIRKISGANGLDLIKQFLIESTLTNILSVIIAVVLVKLFSFSFYNAIGLDLYTDIFQFDRLTLTFLFIVLSFGIFLSGLYPARVIATNNYVNALKGNPSSKKGINFRKFLVIFQFACSFSLIVFVFILQSQFKFISSTKLDINVNSTVVVKAPSNVDSTYLSRLTSFKSGVRELPYVKAVSTSSSVPGDLINWTADVRREKEKTTKIFFDIQVIDDSFFDTYDLKILAGRNFDPSEFPLNRPFGSKVESVIINELGSQRLNFAKPEDAVGQRIFWEETECEIIGVTHNFHQRSLKNPIQPTLFTANYGPSISFKIEPGIYNSNIQSALEGIRSKWNSFFPDNPFDYFFLDAHFQKQYIKDVQFSRFFNFLCGLGIIVSCLGLFGLSSYSTKKRVKEIGIRKVLGATETQITLLLSFEFLRLVIAACGIAIPITLVYANKWLQGYAYHVKISWMLLFVPAILMVLITFLTVSFQTIQAAKTNPAKTLKSE